MKTKLLPAAGGLALALAAACGGQDESATPGATSPSMLSAQAVPKPVAAVPEGVLLVRENSASANPAVFALEGTEAVATGPAAALSVSPDGRRFAIIGRDGAGDGYRLRVLDAKSRAIFETEGSKNTGSPYIPDPLWSGDGTRLAYLGPEPAGTDVTRVYIADLAAGTAEQVTAEAAYYGLVGWASDGRVLVTGSRGIELVGATRQLLALPGGLQASAVALSPDGRTAAVHAGDYEQGLELWLMEIPGGEARRLANIDGEVRQPGAGLYVSAHVPPPAQANGGDALLKGPAPVDWSPDGKRLTYVTATMDGDVNTGWELHVIDVATGQDVSVSQTESWETAWSPDGSYLAFVDERGRLGLLGPDGIRGTEVRAEALAWAPAGKLIVSYPGGMSVTDPATGATVEVAADGGESMAAAYVWSDYAAWSPSGRYVAFTAPGDRYTRGAMFVLDAETARATVVLESGAFEGAGWLVSPAP